MNNYAPPKTPMLDENGNLVPGWQQWVDRTHNNASTLQQSGPTAERPDTLLWIGRYFFDTTLTKPVWVKSVSASGVATWCDATGATV